MKLATFELGGQRRLGAVVDAGQRLLDLAGAFERRHRRPEPALADMLAFIDAGEGGWAVAEALVADPPGEDVGDLAGVQLLAPLPEPRQIRDFLCFEEHLRNAYAQMERMSGRKMEIPAGQLGPAKGKDFDTGNVTRALDRHRRRDR